MENIGNIRNFVIISHIDHGKSTLADRFLELTGSVSKRNFKNQFLDSMDLERERGITIKMHPCRMLYSLKNKNYVLNLIDTPGHTDFSYEISRALACVEGAVLLVDAVKGIQAQTIFNLESAQKQNLKVIGVVNKIDLPGARTKETKKELSSLLGVPEEEILEISAKTGQGVENLLEVVVSKIPPPSFSPLMDKLRALVFDSKYDPFFGVVAFCRIFEGEVKKGEKIYLLAKKAEAETKEVGYFLPQQKSAQNLKTGEIGYIKTGIKNPSQVRIGETISSRIEPRALSGYGEPQPVLFLSVYPYNSNEYENLKSGLEKLQLNDPSLVFSPESKTTLGRGFRCGFLGSLHSEITISRLKSEFSQDLIATSPQVAFKVETDEGEIIVSSPSRWPQVIKRAFQPQAEIEILTPNEYIGRIFKILKTFDISIEKTTTFTAEKSFISGIAPLREIVGGDFYNALKSVTQGYASFSFQEKGYVQADLVKLDILINGIVQEPFSKIIPKVKAQKEGREILKKLKSVLPSQQFSLPLQAAVGGKIIARETLKAQRKDVTAPLYGGDVTRKRKLLEKQKKGKKKLKEKGKVRIPSDIFLKMLKRD